MLTHTLNVHVSFEDFQDVMIFDHAGINQPLDAKVKFPERREIANTLPYIFNAHNLGMECSIKDQ